MSANQEYRSFNRKVRGLHKCLEKNPPTPSMSPVRIGVAARAKAV